MYHGSTDREPAAGLGPQAGDQRSELEGLGAAGDQGQDREGPSTVSAGEWGVSASPVKGTP